MPNINRNLLNGEMSDVVMALEKAVKSAMENVVGNLRNGKITVPFFVTLQSKGKRDSYAWVTDGMVWHKKNGEENVALAHELNICAETLDRPLEDTFITIVHELVHLFNIENGIKDNSRNGQFHNKKFAEQCENFFLKCEQGTEENGMKKYGYHTHFSMSEQLPELQQAFEQWKKDISCYVDLLTIGLDEEIKEQKEKKAKKKDNAIKYSCQCGKSFRATSRMRVICADCFEKENRPIYFLAEDDDVFIEKEEEQSIDVEQEDVPAETVPAETVPAETVPAEEEKKAKSTKKTTTSRARKSKTLPIDKAADSVPSLKDLPIEEECSLPVNILGGNL